MFNAINLSQILYTNFSFFFGLNNYVVSLVSFFFDNRPNFEGLNNYLRFYREFFSTNMHFKLIHFDNKIFTKFISFFIVNKSKQVSGFIKQQIKKFLTGSLFKTEQLTDLTAVDMLGRSLTILSRFVIYYILFSYFFKNRIFLATTCSDEHSVFSLTEFFFCASWLERECFDMFGVRFLKNVDLRRILTDYGFRGYPLRKDFPLVGFKQVKFDELVSCVIYEKFKVMQIEREVLFINPWVSIKKPVKSYLPDLNTFCPIFFYVGFLLPTLLFNHNR